jgi:hypothetical protein
MYSYPNMIDIPSSNYSTPCSQRRLHHFTTLIDASLHFHLTLPYFTSLSSHLVLPLLSFLPPHLHFTSPHFCYLHPICCFPNPFSKNARFTWEGP